MIFSLPTLFSRKFPLDPNQPAIVVPVTLTNGEYQRTAQFLLDTGASLTIISPALADALKLKTNAGNSLEFTTASGVIETKAVTIPMVSVLKQQRENVPAAITPLPPQADIEGLLGLSFLKHFDLRINYTRGWMTLR